MVQLVEGHCCIFAERGGRLPFTIAGFSQKKGSTTCLHTITNSWKSFALIQLSIAFQIYAGEQIQIFSGDKVIFGIGNHTTTDGIWIGLYRGFFGWVFFFSVLLVFSGPEQGHSCLTKQASKHPLGVSQETPSISQDLLLPGVVQVPFFPHNYTALHDYIGLQIGCCTPRSTYTRKLCPCTPSEFLLLRKMQEFQCLQLNQVWLNWQPNGGSAILGYRVFWLSHLHG